MLPSYDLDSIAARLASGMDRLDMPTQDREAAVAVILRELSPRGEAELLLIRRAEREGDPWSGHMALPGGRREPGDESLFAAAVRETREEVGIDITAHGERIGRLPDVHATALGKRVGMIVAPFVVALRGAPELALNDEVAEALWVPLGPLARLESAGLFPYTHDGHRFEMPGLRVGEHVVWGMTYRMLTTLFDALHSA